MCSTSLKLIAFELVTLFFIYRKDELGTKID